MLFADAHREVEVAKKNKLNPTALSQASQEVLARSLSLSLSLSCSCSLALSLLLFLSLSLSLSLSIISETNLLTCYCSWRRLRRPRHASRTFKSAQHTSISSAFPDVHSHRHARTRTHTHTHFLSRARARSTSFVQYLLDCFLLLTQQATSGSRCSTPGLVWVSKQWSKSTDFLPLASPMRAR